jgi:hypothetical protein
MSLETSVGENSVTPRLYRIAEVPAAFRNRDLQIALVSGV